MTTTLTPTAMEVHFDRLADCMATLCPPPLAWTLALRAESSDFVRFNHAAIRQPGHVTLAQATVRVIDDGRHASRMVALSGQIDDDAECLRAACADLRALLPTLPADPYLTLNTAAQTSRRIERSSGADAHNATRDIIEIARGQDLVGILAAGPMMSGCATSHGVRHWHEVDAVAFDFSLHAPGNRAVKALVAGHDWKADAFARALDRAHAQLGLLERTPRVLTPDSYRVFLAPAAVGDLLDLLQWGGFSAKEQATKRSSLQLLVDGQARLHDRFTLTDDLATGYAPGFDSLGHLRQSPLPLINHGQHAHAIVCARTGAEYGIAPTGADDEHAVALALDAGDLPSEEATAALGDGLYINNLWYLNYSDRARARVTGMTRFATLWVENGVAVAPCEPMRFDDTIYALFGTALEALTQERELIVDSSSYGFRSTSTSLVPGALVSRMNFTL